MTDPVSFLVLVLYCVIWVAIGMIICIIIDWLPFPGGGPAPDLRTSAGFGWVRGPYDIKYWLKVIVWILVIIQIIRILMGGPVWIFRG